MKEPVTVEMPDPADSNRLRAALTACRERDNSEGEPGLDLLLDGLPGQNRPFTVSLERIVYAGDSIGRGVFFTALLVANHRYGCRILWQGDDHQPEISLSTSKSTPS